MQSQPILFSSVTSTSSQTKALSRIEQALKYMSQLETAFREGAYGTHDKPFEQALRALLSLLKSCLGGATPSERMENPTHLLVRLLALMSEDALRNLSDEVLRTEYVATVHAALDLIIIQSYEENWVSLPKTLRTVQGEISLLSIISEFDRGLFSIPRQYELDCCKENIQALLEKKSDWTKAFEVTKLALGRDIQGLLRYANELRKEIRPLWPVIVLLLRRLTPLAQQSSKALALLQTIMAEECQRTEFHCHYAAQEALVDVIALSKGNEKESIRRQALGGRVKADEIKAVRVQPTYWYWAQNRPPEHTGLRKMLLHGVKQEDRCRYRLIQGVGELLVQELESKERSKDDVLNQLIEMLFYLQETEPAYLKETQGWIQALSDKVHKDKPKAFYLTGFSQTHPGLEKTHLADEQKRLEEELRFMQVDFTVQREELNKIKQEKQALAAKHEALLKKETAWKQQETTLLQDKAKLEEDKAALLKGKEKDQKQVESLKRQCTRVKKQLEAAESTQQDLIDELSELKQGEEPAVMQGRIQELTEELKTERTKVAQLSASMQTFSKELQTKTELLQQKEQALEKDRLALAERQRALEKAETELAEQTKTLKREQERLTQQTQELIAQEAHLKKWNEELREKEASLQSLEQIFALQMQEIESGIKKPKAPIAISSVTPSHPATSPSSLSVAQRLAALPQEGFDEVLCKQAEDMSEEVIGIDFRCQVLKRPAYDALTLRLATKAGYEEEHLISEEAARGWLIDQQKTTCPCCQQEVVGIGINRPIRKLVMSTIQSALLIKPASTTSPREPVVLSSEPKAALSFAMPPKDIRQAVPASPPSTPSITGIFKRAQEAPGSSLDVKGVKEAKEVLEHVAYGRQDEAEVLLKVKPWLAFVYGGVEEPCGRRFERISSFQLAVWSLDWHMWEMMVRCFKDEDFVKAANQYKELEEKGTEHGKQFSLDPLIEAVKTYCEKFDDWTDEERQHHCHKVIGGEQGKLPMHVVQEYCRLDRSFAMRERERIFKESALPRWKGREKEWFHLESTMDGGVYKKTIGGREGTWAWTRGTSIRLAIVHTVTSRITDSGLECYLKISADLAALPLLSIVRGQQKSQLSQQLSAKITSTAPAMQTIEPAVLSAFHATSPTAMPLTDTRQAIPATLPSTPSIMGIFKRTQDVPEPRLDAKGIQEAKEVLEHVAYGRQDEAETLLKKHPALAFVDGEVEEPSGRKFKRISPFKLAVWSLDWHMWEMMVRCFKDEDFVKAATQYKELEEKGTEYGKQFSLQPLIEALQTYSKKFYDWTWKQREHHWCKVVGGEQGKLPMHVVQEYCRTDRSFEKREGMFEEKTLPRVKGREREWFHYDGSKEGGVFKYTIGGQGGEWSWAREKATEIQSIDNSMLKFINSKNLVDGDRTALLAMSMTRAQQKSNLGQQLTAKVNVAKHLR